MTISEKLKSLIRSAWDDGAPCLLATQGPNGPNISPKGSMVVFDDTHLAYWERSKRKAPTARGEGFSRLDAVEEWAEREGGEAMYGSGNQNNCLIFAIAYGLGVELSNADAAAVRRALVEHDLMGVGLEGFLPGYGRVADTIAELVLGMDESREGENAPNVRITIESALEDVDDVVTGEGGGVDVNLFHDGVHFWWLKRPE